MSKQVHEIPVLGEGEGFPVGKPVSAAKAAPASAPAPAPAGYESAPAPGVPVVAAPAPTAAPATPTEASLQAAPPPPAPATAGPLPMMPPPQVAPAATAMPAAQAQPAAQSAPQPAAAAAPQPVPSAEGFPPPMPHLAPPSRDTLLTDIDPMGRVETGFSPLGKANPDLVAALQEVVRLTASDLHVTSNAPPMLRVDGSLTPVEGAEVWGRKRVTDALMSLLTDSQRARFEEELELDFGFAISENARFRVNYYRQRDAIGGAFRLIPTEIKPLEALGIPDTVARCATLARGLVLITGPTGSGKSTTLAALIDLVNRTRTDHIVTVEDPIEFMHGNKRSLINQREVGSDTLSFNSALKHVLRQDPDVILIGELRDLETIQVALTAAETGHLVFATLHTQDAAQTIDRVIDVFPPHQQDQIRVQLAATLQGVVCQTLIKSASGKGRVVATEVMVMTPAISNLIREGKTYQIPTALQAGRDLGMFTMDQHLAEIVDRGKITHSAALEKAHDLDAIKHLIHRADPGMGDVAAQMAAAAAEFGEGFT
ncbi:MAG: type IV pilus twitching motility protein PilT, partial [Microbacteriaceae bacterium]|nr:type IV pilus twitching motility protein PilT [Microbacteriaceae bacterium]